MMKVNVATLKAELSKYLEIAQRGGQVVVTSHGEEIAKIGPAQVVTTPAIDWSAFIHKHPVVKPKKKGAGAVALIRKLRDEE